MAFKETLNRIASIEENPCVSISFNTHRTHPANKQDEIVLKNLLRDAENRLLSEFNKREIADLLQKMEELPEIIDHNHNLDSLHIFASNNVLEVVKSVWPTTDKVEINESFSLRPLIKAFNRSAEYLALKITLDDIHLYEVLNDSVVQEISNDFFPFKDGKYEVNNADKGGNPHQVDDRVKELFNRIDKAVNEVVKQLQLDVIVISSDQNLSILQWEADNPGIYVGHCVINNNEIKPHELAKQAWERMKELQYDYRSAAIGEVKEGINRGLAITDLQEIFLAAREGRGDLLIVNQDFQQAVKFSSERDFDLVEDSTEVDVVDDIVTSIAWDVISKNGRVVFTNQSELDELGSITLLARY